MFRKRNWLGETKQQEIQRRVEAVEEHVVSLEERYSALENKYNQANPAPAKQPEE